MGPLPGGRRLSLDPRWILFGSSLNHLEDPLWILFGSSLDPLWFILRIKMDPEMDPKMKLR